jgi:hypothetical protein
MSTILYKRLFEVRILHDYFLSKADLTSYYTLSENDKDEFLKSRISREQYNTGNYLEVVPSASTQTIFDNYRLRIATTPSGFIVGVKVKPQLNDIGEEKYLPTIALNGDLRLGFHLRIKDTGFNTYTNLKIRQPASARYYFSNTNADNVKDFPSLSLPTADFQSGKTYEPGELAFVGGNLQEALEETTSSDASAWRQVDGNGYANEQDRTLLPKLFPYTLSEETGVAEFTLKKQDSTVVKKVTFNTSGAIQTLYLDFRQSDIEDGHYLLEISTDSFTETVPVDLSDELYRRTDAGAMVIKTDVTDTDFRVLNNDGTLITKINADDTSVPHPLFEIRFKRRGTYWRYRSDTGGNLKATADTQPFLNEVGSDLITKDLRPLTYYPTFFANPPQPEVYLPNPKRDSVKKEEKNFFSDMYVSPIKGFIELE